MTVIAKNQTSGDLTLAQLPVPNNQIPASGQVTLTDYATLSEIQEDVELRAYIAFGAVILNVDGSDLSATESAAFASPPSTQIFTSTERGMVPPGGAGTTKFLRQDGDFEVPPGAGAVKIPICYFGAKSDGLGKRLIANGKSSDGDDSSKPKTRHAIGLNCTLVALVYQTKEATSTTKMRIHVAGSSAALVTLANINATFGGVETISISANAGDIVEIEYDSDDKPGECTMYLLAEAT